MEPFETRFAGRVRAYTDPATERRIDALAVSRTAMSSRRAAGWSQRRSARGRLRSSLRRRSLGGRARGRRPSGRGRRRRHRATTVRAPGVEPAADAVRDLGDAGSHGLGRRADPRRPPPFVAAAVCRSCRVGIRGDGVPQPGERPDRIRAGAGRGSVTVRDRGRRPRHARRHGHRRDHGMRDRGRRDATAGRWRGGTPS